MRGVSRRGGNTKRKRGGRGREREKDTDMKKEIYALLHTTGPDSVIDVWCPCPAPCKGDAAPLGRIGSDRSREEPDRGSSRVPMARLRRISSIGSKARECWSGATMMSYVRRGAAAAGVTSAHTAPFGCARLRSFRSRIDVEFKVKQFPALRA